MKNIPKEKIKAAIATLVVHVLLLLLLCSLVMTRKPQEPEEGVAVVLGDVEDAFGKDIAMTEVNVVRQQKSEQPKQVAPIHKSAPEEEVVTQEQEETVAIPSKKETPKKSRQEIEAERKAREAAEQKAREDAERKAREEAEKRSQEQTESTVSKAFRLGNNMNSGGGIKPESGHQGAPGGNSESGVLAKLGKGNRKPLSTPKPKCSVSQATTVVVDIEVRPDGTVMSAKIASVLTDPANRDAILHAVYNTKFEKSSGVENETGTITYKID